ncbi:MAG: 3-dehydroquinate synthase [Peptococcaceae bacterium]|nr:3-dehydroquinate synthase [Peptococcaceae bacterium]
MELIVDIPGKAYPIYIERGSIKNLAAYLNLNRKIMVITDDGVPKEYLETVLAQLPQGYHHVVKQGEGAKSLPVFGKLCQKLLDCGFHRNDAVIALGGGVVGDLSGYVAASYMRGIDFINIPTTTLSQVDSSIGGKVAVNLGEVKNIVGAFYQPKAVIIDSDTLATLTKRHFYNGLVEALKAALIGNEHLFDLFVKGEIEDNIDEIIYQSLLVKKAVVEADETEQGQRALLNLGHTLGHGIESIFGLGGLYHGECVALGMLPMIENDALRKQVKDIFQQKLHIPTDTVIEKEHILEIIAKDKKMQGKQITIVKVPQVGKAYLEKVDFQEIKTYVDKL